MVTLYQTAMYSQPRPQGYDAQQTLQHREAASTHPNPSQFPGGVQFPSAFSVASASIPINTDPAYHALWSTSESETRPLLVPTSDCGISSLIPGAWVSPHPPQENYPPLATYSMPVSRPLYVPRPILQPQLGVRALPAYNYPPVPGSIPTVSNGLLFNGVGMQNPVISSEASRVAPVVHTYMGNAHVLENSKIWNQGIILNSVSQAPDVTVLALLQPYICPQAMFNGDDRPDAPICHPGTRKSIITDIEPWAISADSENGILWLKGPVGVGKSAISHSVCKDLADQHASLLAGSFFFCRSDNNRNSLKSFIATLAYRLAIAIPEAGKLIALALSQDPAILNYSFEDKWKALIIEPLRQVSLNRNDTRRSLIVIDGLDECESPSNQRRLLQLLPDLARYHLQRRVSILISSRPERNIEHEIQLLVSNYPALFRHPHLELTNTEESRADMWLVLNTHFDSIRRRHASIMLNRHWPPVPDINRIVNNAGGQFLYPHTIIQWLQEEGANPIRRLQAILYSHEGDKLPAFAPLDHLYNLILGSLQASADKKDCELVLPCLFLVIHKFVYEGQPTDEGFSLNYICDIAEILEEETSTIRLILQRLQSVLRVPDSDKGAIEVYHTSFVEYLCDGSRSGTHFVKDPRVLLRLLLRALTPKLAFSTSLDIMQLWFLLPVRPISPWSPDLLSALAQLNAVNWLREHHLRRIQSSAAPWGTEYGDQYYWILYKKQYYEFYRWLVTFIPQEHESILFRNFPPNLFDDVTEAGYMSLSSWVKDFRIGLLSSHQITWMLFALFFRSLYQGSRNSFSGFDDLARRCIQNSCLLQGEHSCTATMNKHRERQWLLEVIDALAVADNPGNSLKTLCEVMTTFITRSTDQDDESISVVVRHFFAPVDVLRIMVSAGEMYNFDKNNFLWHLIRTMRDRNTTVSIDQKSLVVLKEIVTWALQGPLRYPDVAYRDVAQFHVEKGRTHQVSQEVFQQVLSEQARHALWFIQQFKGLALGPLAFLVHYLQYSGVHCPAPNSEYYEWLHSFLDQEKTRYPEQRRCNEITSLRGT